MIAPSLVSGEFSIDKTEKCSSMMPNGFVGSAWNTNWFPIMFYLFILDLSKIWHDPITWHEHDINKWV